MYAVVTHDEARAQLEELPARLVTGYLEARAALETSPWTAGRSSKPSNPDANIYVIDVGDEDDDLLVYYAIAERDREVHVLEVLWLSGVESRLHRCPRAADFVAGLEHTDELHRSRVTDDPAADTGFRGGRSAPAPRAPSPIDSKGFVCL